MQIFVAVFIVTFAIFMVAYTICTLLIMTKIDPEPEPNCIGFTYVEPQNQMVEVMLKNGQRITKIIQNSLCDMPWLVSFKKWTTKIQQGKTDNNWSDEEACKQLRNTMDKNVFSLEDVKNNAVMHSIANTTSEQLFSECCKDGTFNHQKVYSIIDDLQNAMCPIQSKELKPKGINAPTSSPFQTSSPAPSPST